MITLFFHVNATDGQVRICGVERTEFVERRRTAVIQRMLNRAAKLERALDRQTREMR